MTIGELIAELQKFPLDMPVVYTYEGIVGGIDAVTVESVEGVDMVVIE